MKQFLLPKLAFHVKTGRDCLGLENSDSPKLNPGKTFAILLGFPELRGNERRGLAWNVSHNLFPECCLRRHPAEAQTTLEWMS